MRRPAALSATLLVTLMLTAGCGTSDYCVAVEKYTSSLNSYGSQADRSNETYTAYADMFTDLAAVSPDSLAPGLKDLSEATAGVVQAHEEAGIKLEEMRDEELVKGLGKDKIAQLNEAYERYNEAVRTHGEAVVKNVKQECDITLK